MEYKDLMEAFAKKLGIADLTYDADGIARIAADDMTIAFMELPQSNEVLMWGVVATPPPGNLEKLYAVMFEAMFMGRGTQGAHFSKDGESIYLQRQVPLIHQDAESFSPVVEKFLNTLEEWRTVIQNFRPDESAAAPEAPSFGTSGAFMQV